MSSKVGSGVEVSPKKPEDNTFEVIIIAILIIVLLIVLTATVYYLRRRAECFTYPSPWCHDDWICEDLPDDQQNRWDMLKNLKLASVPSTQGLCFLSDGTPNKACKNVWTFLDNTVCSGPQGAHAPCNTPYSSLPTQGAS